MRKIPTSLFLFGLLLFFQAQAAATDSSREQEHHEHASGELAASAQRPGIQGDFTDLDLSQHEGKVVVLVSLAGWCVGCFAEVPNFIQLHEDYADRDVVVIGVIMQSAPEWTEPSSSASG